MSDEPRADEEVISRRRLLNRLSLTLSGLAGFVVSVPIIAYLLSPLLNPAKNVWRDVGPVSQFRIDETVQVEIQDPSPLPWAGQTATTAAWLRRTEQGFTAFAVNCTHLGSPVNWLGSAEIFICPCHGGVFYADGAVAAGPPPRPLWRHEVRVRDDRVEVLTRPLQVG